MHQPFTFTAMPKLIFGPKAVGRIGELTASYGRTALLVTGSRALARSGALSLMLDDMNASGVSVFQTRIAGEPSPSMVDMATKGIRGKHVDVVVAVGGGSVLDAGKAIAAMLKETGSVTDYLEGVGTRNPTGRSTPMIAIPTTSGTGSEATKNAVISKVGKDGFKKSLRHDNYIPRIAVLDPTLCAGAPPLVTAACGMDALTQLIESYVSIHASPLTDALALDGMRHLIPALPDACGEGAHDVGCRGAMAYGAFLSGVTLANAGLGVVHGVAGPMGGLISIPHGIACANLLPYAIDTTVKKLSTMDTQVSITTMEKLACVGKLFGASDKDQPDCCRHLVDCLYRMLDQFDIPRLSSFGLTAALVDALIPASSNKKNPLPLSAGQMRQMIQDRL